MRLLTLCRLGGEFRKEVVPALEYVLEPTYSAPMEEMRGKSQVYCPGDRQETQLAVLGTARGVFIHKETIEHEDNKNH